MVPPELVSYIAEQTQDGISAEILRQTLMEAGWRELDIDNALHDVAAGLEPVTVGASIHADLAQVRGMVAHLASRVRMLEARLTGTALPMQLELPTGTIGPERELSRPAVRRPARIRHIIALFIAIAVSLFGYSLLSTLVAHSFMATGMENVVTIAVGAVILAVGYAAMRFHRAWLASLGTDVGVALLALTTWVAYHEQHAMEWSVALALGVLLFVIFVVMERWISRLAK